MALRHCSAVGADAMHAMQNAAQSGMMQIVVNGPKLKQLD